MTEPLAGDEKEDSFTYSTFLSGLSITRDVISAAKPSVAAGFDIASHSVATGFGFGRKILTVSGDSADDFGVPVIGTTLRTIDGVVEFAQECTTLGMGISKELTLSSLEATDSLLHETGATPGETMRILEKYVESQRGMEGHEVKEAMLGVAKLLGKLEAIEVTQPLMLMSGARELSKIKMIHKLERRNMNKEKFKESPPTELTGEEASLMQRYMKFAAASYGYQALYFLNVFRHSELKGLDITSDKDAITAMTGVSAENILKQVQQGEIYRPGHYVAIDRSAKTIVLSIRGTMRVQDVLVDLVCEQEKFESIFDGDEVITGKAHQGFLIAAKRLASELHVLIVETLLENPGYDLVLTGHSLGAGVATILTLIWARMPVFQKRNIRAYTFASPCSLCSELSQAPFTKRHVTSVVVGDDVVGRLSLSNFKDLQRALTAVAPLSTISHGEKMEIYKSLKREDVEKKLFCSGRVWLLRSEEFDFRNVLINPIDVLHFIELSPTMFSVHLPSGYLDCLAEVVESN